MHYTLLPWSALQRVFMKWPRQHESSLTRSATVPEVVIATAEPAIPGAALQGGRRTRVKTYHVTASVTLVILPCRQLIELRPQMLFIRQSARFLVVVLLCASTTVNFLLVRAAGKLRGQLATARILANEATALRIGDKVPPLLARSADGALVNLDFSKDQRPTVTLCIISDLLVV
jgi:hypothetical protein